MKDRSPDWQRIELAKKALLHELGKEESELYESWYKTDPAFRQAVEALADKANLKTDLDRLDKINQSAGWKKLQEKVAKRSGTGTSNSRFTVGFRYTAASVAVILMAALIWLNQSQIQEKAPLAETTEILPGKDQAILRLSNGEEAILGEDSKGTVAGNQQFSVVVADRLAQITSKGSGLSDADKLNELETPVGGRYQIQLEDGTKVWLNAHSKIQFPDQFGDKERTVKLWGEAYFEVAKDQERPFSVNVYRDNPDDPTVIKVLGTHFNIMAYADESAVSTTLVEGSVEVHRTGNSIKLTPGNQALAIPGKDKIEVKKANIEAVTGWKNRMFVFENEPLEGIMRKIGRWYNIDVKYLSDVRNKKFSGIISQDNEISAVVDLLEATEEVSIQFESKSTLTIK